MTWQSQYTRQWCRSNPPLQNFPTEQFVTHDVLFWHMRQNNAVSQAQPLMMTFQCREKKLGNYPADNWLSPAVWLEQLSEGSKDTHLAFYFFTNSSSFHCNTTQIQTESLTRGFMSDQRPVVFQLSVLLLKQFIESSSINKRQISVWDMLLA